LSKRLYPLESAQKSIFRSFVKAFIHCARLLKIIVQQHYEALARRRFQDPRPKRRGKWWTIQVRRDQFVGGQLQRKKTRVRIAPATLSEREARKIAAEYLRPQNQGLELVGSATNFGEFVEGTYRPIVMPLMARTTQERSRGVIANYLVPEFGKLSLRDLTPLRLQRYFSGLAASSLAHESRDKIKDVLSSVLGAALQYGLLVKNPVEGIRLPEDGESERPNRMSPQSSSNSCSS